MESAPDILPAIEAAAARAWPAAETAELHGWLLRHSGAGSRRLSSAQTLAYDGGEEIETDIAAVEAWYAQRGQRSCFRLTDAARPECLDATLARRGYGVITPTSVMVAAVHPVPPPPAVAVELLPAADERVLQAICDPTWSAPVRSQRAELFARIAPAHRFALVMDGNTAVAAGLCVVDAGLAGLFTMRTQPSHRRRGIARAIAHRLIAWADGYNPRLLYLQVEDDNAAALHLYGQLGFTRVYGYRYREKVP